jgi:hypothetical protein
MADKKLSKEEKEAIKKKAAKENRATQETARGKKWDRMKEIEKDRKKS